MSSAGSTLPQIDVPDLLGSDPIVDIRATRAIRAVWCAGTVISGLTASEEDHHRE